MTEEQLDGIGSGVDHTSALPDEPVRRRWLRNGGIGVGCAAVAAIIAVPLVAAATAPGGMTSAAVVPAPATSDQAEQPSVDIWPDGEPSGRATAAAGRSPTAGRAAASKAATPNARIVTQSEVLRLVQTHFPATEVSNAMAVASCESGQQSIVGQTNSDGTTDWGIFQLNDGGTLQGAMRRIGAPAETAAAQVAALDAATNVRAAAAIYYDRGWAPWVCAYKQQIVAGLYSNERGPMYGRFTLVGGATAPLLSQEEAAAAVQRARERAAEQKRAAKEAARRAAEEKRAPKPKPKPKPKPVSPVPPQASPPASSPSPSPSLTSATPSAPNPGPTE